MHSHTLCTGADPSLGTFGHSRLVQDEASHSLGSPGKTDREHTKLMDAFSAYSILDWPKVPSALCAKKGVHVT